MGIDEVEKCINLCKMNETGDESSTDMTAVAQGFVMTIQGCIWAVVCRFPSCLADSLPGRRFGPRGVGTRKEAFKFVASGILGPA